MRSEEKKMFSDEIGNEMESQWGRNIQDTFSPPKVSWILLLMIPEDLQGSDQNKTHCHQGGSGRLMQSLSAISFYLVLSGYGVLPPSWLPLSITWTEKESGIMSCQLIQKGEGSRKRSHQPGPCTHVLSPNPSRVFQIPPLFCHHFGFGHFLVF